MKVLAKLKNSIMYFLKLVPAENVFTTPHKKIVEKESSLSSHKKRIYKVS